MPTKFDTWTVQTALEKIADISDAGQSANLSFYAGDHWQKGNAWTGPMLPSTHSQHSNALNRVERIFVSKNAIAETTDRHTAGILGRKPQNTVTVIRPLKADEEPNTQEQALIDEADALLADWLDDQCGVAPRERGETEIKLCTPLEVAALATGSALLTRRGVFRFLFLSPASLIPTEDGQLIIPQTPLNEAIKKIFIQHAESDQAGVMIDQETMSKVGIFTYKDPNGKEFAELSYLDGEETVLRITNRKPQTRRGLNQKNLQDDAIRLPLGGRLTIYEMERSPLISASVRQAQMALNKAKTMESLNLDAGGFLERIFLNATPPGTWEDDPDNPGKKRFAPAALQLGPGTTNFVAGIETTDIEGRKSITSPSVVYRDPTPATTFIQSAQDFYRGILEEVDQLHTLIAGDATASGKSRIQAKDDYMKSLLITKGEVDAALSWMLETVLKLAALFAGTPDYFDGLRVVVDSQVDLGIVGPEEQAQAVANVSGGLLSQESGMRSIGVQDAAAEMSLIQAEAATSLDSLKQRADIIKTLSDSGIDFRTAGEIAGLDSKLLGLLTKAQEKKDEAAAKVAEQMKAAPTPTGDEIPPTNGKKPIDNQFKEITQ